MASRPRPPGRPVLLQNRGVAPGFAPSRHTVLSSALSQLVQSPSSPLPLLLGPCRPASFPHLRLNPATETCARNPSRCWCQSSPRCERELRVVLGFPPQRPTSSAIAFRELKLVAPALHSVLGHETPPSSASSHLVPHNATHFSPPLATWANRAVYLQARSMEQLPFRHEIPRTRSTLVEVDLELPWPLVVACVKSSGRRLALACIVNTAARREASETRAVVPEDDAGGGAAVCQEGDMRRRAGGQRPRPVCAALHQRLPIQEDGRTGPSSTRRFSAACTPAAQAHALCARVTQPQALE